MHQLLGRLLALVIMGIFLSATCWSAPLGTAFTYQGKLTQNGQPVADPADLRFRLYDSGSGGNQIGLELFAPGIELANDGTFTVDIDFQEYMFLNGEQRWLEIDVRSPQGDPSDPAGFTTLSPRQLITATPYAQFALNTPSAWLEKGSEAIAYMDGNVGIGVSPPAQMLHLSGDSVDSPTIVLQSTVAPANEQAASIYVDPSTGDLGLGRMSDDGLTLNRTDLYIDATSGNVGIGSTNPSYPLYVSGDQNDLGIFSGGTVAVSKSLGDPGTGLSVSRRISNNPLLTRRTEIDGSAIDTYSNLGSSSLVLNSNSTGNVTLATGGGSVGVGTSAPENIMHVYKGSAGTITGHANAPLIIENGGSTYINILAPDTSEQGILFGNPTDGIAAGGIVYNNNSTPDGLEFRVNGNATEMVINSSGNVGIGTSPNSRLHVTSSNDQLAQFTQSGTDPGVVISSISASTVYSALSVSGFSNNAPALSVFGSSSSVPALRVTGTAEVDVLQITGADLAEKFPVSESTQRIEPGAVMEIDPNVSGKLRIARGAYNRRVAGVVSGAGDLPVGAVLGNLPGNESAPPIALSGRVWVCCDASSGSIQPGDLLTTSNTPGHAMKVTDIVSAQGATIGKAMTSLDDGEVGLVLVLVSLQ